jgi:hypothetical protein
MEAINLLEIVKTNGFYQRQKNSQSLDEIRSRIESHSASLGSILHYIGKENEIIMNEDLMHIEHFSNLYVSYRPVRYGIFTICNLPCNYF